jgi:predicted CoA-binding protein
MTSIKDAANDFLKNRRIAVVGVSRSGDVAANLIYKRFRAVGYEVFPVNPKAEEVEGDPCFESVSSIPGGVDAVVVATHPKASEQVVRDCAEAGVSKVWIHHSFGEGSYSAEAVEFCHENGISVIPGWCPLMFGKTADFGHRCMRWVFGLTGKLPKEV